MRMGIKFSLKVENSIVELLSRENLISLLNKLDQDLAAKIVNLTFRIRVTDDETFNIL